jgi:hypothetical protein
LERKLSSLFELDYQNKESLFALFLTSPIFVCHLNDLTSEQWNICQENIHRIMIQIIKIFFKIETYRQYHFFWVMISGAVCFLLCSTSITSSLQGNFDLN